MCTWHKRAAVGRGDDELGYWLTWVFKYLLATWSSLVFHLLTELEMHSRHFVNFMFSLKWTLNRSGLDQSSASPKNFGFLAVDLKTSKRKNDQKLQVLVAGNKGDHVAPCSFMQLSKKGFHNACFMLITAIACNGTIFCPKENLCKNS